MHILWVSNYSTQSGYANQARLFVPRMKAAGHKMTVFEISSASGMAHEIDGIQIIPTHLDPLGGDIILEHVHRLKADCVITLIDAWAMRPHIMQELNWTPLVPVDHMPLPPAIAESLQSAKVPIAISRWGQEVLGQAGFSAHYIPHAIDPDVWHPQDRMQARQRLGISPDVFFVSFVGVNDNVPSRKGIPELLTAWSIFSQRHANVGLYLHTSEQGNLPQSGTGGVRIDLLMKTLQIDPHSIKFVDQYRYKTGIPARELALIAAASDALVLPTRGEGFGLPLIEFQRAGCPVITTNYGAGAELCASQWLLNFDSDWDWQSSFAAKVDVSSLIDRLEEAYEARGNIQYRKDAVNFASQYDIDRVMAQYALPVVENIAEMLLDRTVIG